MESSAYSERSGVDAPAPSLLVPSWPDEVSIGNVAEPAWQFAYRMHEGQVDKGGRPYFDHLRRVAHRCSHDPVTQMVAWLHDVVEDTPVTFGELRELGYRRDVLYPLSLLTHDIGGRYDVYIESVSLDPTATEVKIADLLDNLDPRRTVNDDPEGVKRRHRKHWRALNRLITGRWEEPIDG